MKIIEVYNWKPTQKKLKTKLKSKKNYCKALLANPPKIKFEIKVLKLFKWE